MMRRSMVFGLILTLFAIAACRADTTSMMTTTTTARSYSTSAADTTVGPMSTAAALTTTVVEPPTTTVAGDGALPEDLLEGLPDDMRAALTGVTGEPLVYEDQQWYDLLGIDPADPSTDIPIDIALRAFATVWGDVPGAKAGTLDPEIAAAHAEEIARIVLYRSEELTAEQRDAVVLALGLSPVAEAETASRLVDGGEPAGSGVQGLRRVPTGSAENRQLFADLDELVAAIAVYRRYITTVPLQIAIRRGSVPPHPGAAGSAHALTLPASAAARLGLADGASNTCTVVTYPLLDSVTANNPAYRRFILHHEAFHCIQLALAAQGGQPPLLIEGSAEYAAIVATPGFNDDYYWGRYLATPSAGATFSLPSASYNAAGFYFWLEAHLGRAEVFQRIADQLTVGRGQSAMTAVANLSGGDTSLFVDWAASVANQLAWSARWHTPGEGITPGLRRTPTPQTVAVGSPIFIDAPEAANTLRRVSVAGVEVLDVAAINHVVTRWEPSGQEQQFSGTTTQRYCLLDQCLCPDGNPPTGGAGTPMPGANALIVAANGDHRAGSGFGAVARSLGDLCQPPRTPNPDGRLLINVVGGSVGGADLPIVGCIETTTDFGPSIEVYAGDWRPVGSTYSLGEGPHAVLTAAAITGTTDAVVVAWNDVSIQYFGEPVEVTLHNDATATLTNADNYWSGTFSGSIFDPRAIDPNFTAPIGSASGSFVCP
jgi:hypothetical protein